MIFTLWHTGEFGHGERSFCDWDLEMIAACVTPSELDRLRLLTVGERLVDEEGDTWERRE